MFRRAVSLALPLLVLAGCDKKPDAEKTPSADAPGVQSPAVATVPAVTAPPKRRAGQWAQTVSTAGMTQKSNFCTNDAVEAAVGWWSQQATAGMCAKQTISPQPDGSWRFESECDLGSGGKTVSKGVASGDFNSAYKVEVDSATTGAAAPHMNGAHKMSMTASYTGPCPAGVRPGDMQLAGGMTINVLDLAKARK